MNRTGDLRPEQQDWITVYALLVPCLRKFRKGGCGCCLRIGFAEMTQLFVL